MVRRRSCLKIFNLFYINFFFLLKIFNKFLFISTIYYRKKLYNYSFFKRKKIFKRKLKSNFYPIKLIFKYWIKCFFFCKAINRFQLYYKFFIYNFISYKNLIFFNKNYIFSFKSSIFLISTNNLELLSNFFFYFTNLNSKNLFINNDIDMSHVLKLKLILFLINIINKWNLTFLLNYYKICIYMNLLNLKKLN